MRICSYFSYLLSAAGRAVQPRADGFGVGGSERVVLQRRGRQRAVTRPRARVEVRSSRRSIFAVCVSRSCLHFSRGGTIFFGGADVCCAFARCCSRRRRVALFSLMFVRNSRAPAGNDEHNYEKAGSSTYHHMSNLEGCVTGRAAFLFQCFELTHAAAHFCLYLLGRRNIKSIKSTLFL